MNYEDAKICSSCLDIYGFLHTGEEAYYQKCHLKCPDRDLKIDMPHGEKNQLPWDGFDYNEVVTLCYCCGTELLRSGSRWSVWFCEQCKERVVEFNTEADRTIIPIGRHSLMHGIGLKVEPLVSKIKIIATIDEFNQLRASIAHLERWRKIPISRNWRSAELDSGQDVGLVKFLHSVEGFDKERAFIGMRDFFQV